MSFVNSSIIAKVAYKPHLVLVDGYWRVSKMPNPIPVKHKDIWYAAQRWIAEQNAFVANQQHDQIKQRARQKTLDRMIGLYE